MRSCSSEIGDWSVDRLGADLMRRKKKFASPPRAMGAEILDQKYQNGQLIEEGEDYAAGV